MKLDFILGFILGALLLSILGAYVSIKDSDMPVARSGNVLNIDDRVKTFLFDAYYPFERENIYCLHGKFKNSSIDIKGIVPIKGNVTRSIDSVRVEKLVCPSISGSENVGVIHTHPPRKHKLENTCLFSSQDLFTFGMIKNAFMKEEFIFGVQCSPDQYVFIDKEHLEERLRQT